METHNLSLDPDPISASLKSLIVVVFCSSSSPLYPLAVSIATAVPSHSEIDLGQGKILHTAIFERNGLAASRALALLKVVGGWKSTQVFTDGRYVADAWQTCETLECFIKGCASYKREAYCFEITKLDTGEIFTDGRVKISEVSQDPTTPTLYQFPCKHIHSRFQKKDLPGVDLQDQVQATAVDLGCNWCPFFDPANFKPLEK